LIGVFVAARQLGLRSPAFWGVFTFFILNTGFFAFYGTWDKFAFLLQSIIVLFYFGAFSLNSLMCYITSKSPQSSQKLKLAVASTLLVSASCSMLFFDFLWERSRNAEGYWGQRYKNSYSENLYDSAKFILVPNKRSYREVELFADALFEKLPAGSIYMDDDSRSYYPLAYYYQKYYHLRPDVRIYMTNSWGVAGWGNSAQDLARILEIGYLNNLPVFLVSLKHPFPDVLAELNADLDIQFEKFPLEGGRWVYRLITANEQGAD
jgi:hypothetical protein